MIVLTLAQLKTLARVARAEAERPPDAQRVVITWTRALDQIGWDIDAYSKQGTVRITPDGVATKR